jgi:hypothetical protein
MQADISQNEKISLKIYIKIKKNNFNTKYVNLQVFLTLSKDFGSEKEEKLIMILQLSSSYT